MYACAGWTGRVHTMPLVASEEELLLLAWPPEEIKSGSAGESGVINTPERGRTDGRVDG